MSQLEREFTKLGLSHRPAQVAALVCEGLSNQEIASQLGLHQKTVKGYLTNVYDTLNIKSRLQLMLWCFRKALREPDFASSIRHSSDFRTDEAAPAELK